MPRSTSRGDWVKVAGTVQWSPQTRWSRAPKKAETMRRAVHVMACVHGTPMKPALRRSARLAERRVAPAARAQAPRSQPTRGTAAAKNRGAPVRGVAGSSKAGLDRGFEDRRLDGGFRVVVGVDEAGRGPLAGPVVAAACALPEGCTIPGVCDSKAIDEPSRERLYDTITTTPGESHGKRSGGFASRTHARPAV